MVVSSRCRWQLWLLAAMVVDSYGGWQLRSLTSNVGVCSHRLWLLVTMLLVKIVGSIYFHSAAVFIGRPNRETPCSWQ